MLSRHCTANQLCLQSKAFHKSFKMTDDLKSLFRAKVSEREGQAPTALARLKAAKVRKQTLWTRAQWMRRVGREREGEREGNLCQVDKSNSAA